MQVGAVALALAPLLYKNMADYITKARYWMAICYPENMIDDWELQISTRFQVPYCYIIHNKDLNTDGESRKVHVHILIALGNTATYNSALSIFKTLQKDGFPTFIPNDEIRQVKNIRNVYDYFIHDTPDCKKLGKHLYNKSERVCGNAFDIGSYEQLGQAEKDQIIISISKLCIDNCIYNFTDLIEFILSHYDLEYFSIVKSNAGYFQAITKGIYLRRYEMLNDDLAGDTTTKKNVPCADFKEEEIDIK